MIQRKRKLSSGGNVWLDDQPVMEPVIASHNNSDHHQCRIILPRDYVAPDSSHYEKSAREMLQEALTTITSSPTGQIFGRERLFRTVQNLCVLKQGHETFRQMVDHYKAHCKEEMQTLHEKIEPDQIEAIHAVWMTHCRQMKTIISIYMYLDRAVLKPGTIESMGKDIFRNELMNGGAWARMIRALMDRFREEREGVVHMDDSTTLIRDIVIMTCELSLYDIIESEFLKETKEFYDQEGISMCSAADLDVANYLEHVRTRLEQETARVQAYLQPHTLSQTVASIEQKLVAQHLSTLIENGFAALMGALPATLSSLSLLFQLASRIKGQDRIKQALHDYVLRCSMDILQGNTSHIGEGDVIDKIGTFKDSIDTVVQEAGEMVVDLQHSCKDAFEAVFKSRGNLPAELLSKHIDWLLKGSMKISEDELEAILNRCMVIFKFIHGKDMFEAFYKSALAQRLLLEQSCSQAAEINMIGKLRTECGALFTTRLEGMFKDIELSKEIVAQYPGLGSEQFEFRPTVLTVSNWPQSLSQLQSAQLIIPPSIVQHQTNFEQFYVSRHSGRKLTWVYHVSNAIITGHFSLGKKELVVSSYQALVLLAFNNAPDILSYVYLRDRTGLPDEQLKHALGTLCKEKLRVLKKKKKGPVIDIDEFQVNRSFSHQCRRISAFTRPIEAKTENEEVENQVHADRMYQIDAILVRHMKAVKSCSQTELIRYCLDQCGFPAPVEDIHKRINSLLDREYIERDDKNANTFRYVA